MGSSGRKKQKELWTFDQFQRVHPLPNGIVDGDGENPDIVVYAADCRLGIEITDIYHGSELGSSDAMAAAGNREGVMRLLKKELHSRNVPPVDVSVHFSGSLQFRSGGQRALANRLADYVVARLPEVGEVFTSSGAAWPIDEGLPAEVFAITVARYPCLTRISCDAPECLAIPDLQARDVRQCVAGKDRRVAAYRQRCDKVWLVMCINTANLATNYSLDECATSVEVVTEFDRVFLFSVFDRYACEVRRAGHIPATEFITP